ncbi:hypothetical protein [Terriglobus aquaticus]|uniref:Uncharacterized protein n=1 Tax=Terriglobus aquaticus TaxID=940139 RepID=A0ABW9KKE7_9BACT|nr:hypothetical protein [Terriglobus aquaticus]
MGQGIAVCVQVSQEPTSAEELTPGIVSGDHQDAAILKGRD